ncbi:MAG: hypothetical protein P8177_04425 [Gemmatimonadota bacterium]|jgi:hypothetical protein
MLATIPDLEPDEQILARTLPVALLFVLGGVVFGMSHPRGRDWTGAFLLGWVPAIVGLVIFAGDPGLETARTALTLLAAPAALAAAGAWFGAVLVRARS